MMQAAGKLTLEWMSVVDLLVDEISASHSRTRVGPIEIQTLTTPKIKRGPPARLHQHVHS